MELRLGFRTTMEGFMLHVLYTQMHPTSIALEHCMRFLVITLFVFIYYIVFKIFRN